MTDHTSQLRASAARLAAHIDRIPPSSRTQAFLALERVHQLLPDDTPPDDIDRRSVVELVRLGNVAAEHMDRYDYGRLSGVVRQLARRVIELDQRNRQLTARLGEKPAPADEWCPTCGAQVAQSGRGRPRVHCSDLCRSRAASQQHRARRDRNGKLAA